MTTITINFKVRCETIPEQELRIVGEHQILGQWMPSQGLKLSTNQELYPIWVGHVSFEFEQNSLIEFKAIKVFGHEICWESGENRVIQLRYQTQSVLFAFDSSFTQTVKIQSFLDSFTDSDSESLYKCDIKKITFDLPYNPLDYEYISSESEKESLTRLSFYDLNLIQQSSSLNNSKNNQPENMFEQHSQTVSSFKE